MSTQSLSSPATEGNTPIPSARDAYSAMLEAQALIRVLIAAADYDDNGFDFVTMLKTIQEKLDGPTLFCDAESCNRRLS